MGRDAHAGGARAVNAIPRISIVIPTLNEEKLLDGMLRQFTPDLRARYALELVVSDGGSTDRTLEIARGYECRIVENRDGVKQTISLGRNLGADQAAGEVLIFLNADTLIADPGQFFRRMTEELGAPGLAALTCSVGVYPEEERWSDRAFHGFYNWLFALMNVTGMGMGRGECHVIPRAVFARARGYAPHIAAGEDYDMFRRLKDLGRIRFLKDVRVFESPRRYRQYGYLYVSASWFLNFLAVFFLRRSILSEWKPVR
jgi:glycosyltransferase involved in cell wall biosynthesis